MAKFYPMFSSSKGNSTYIGTAESGIIVDAGVTFKKICEALDEGGITLDQINAVLVTHEHTDHVKGLKTLLKKTGAVLIASRETIYALHFMKLIDDSTNRIYADECEEITIKDMKIRRFATSHDCKGSSGYTVSFKGIKVALCTDTGVLTEQIRENLNGSKLVMLESNHDPVMLRLGPYPPELKIRIGSDKGHLANADCAAEIKRLYRGGTTHFVLAHLSENNNTAQKADAAVRAALMDLGAKQNEDYILYTAPAEKGRIISL